jgi:methyltransferase-like protein/SAM-dependent methyltransferase
MTKALTTSYDELPYTNNPFTHSHPSRLAAIATLFGLQPAPVERCRVLELGCAAGGNIIPLAESFPESRFVGIDLSSRQVAAGKEGADALGLKNLDLQAVDLMNVDDRLGLFDYIICHGVYSWVPDFVQDKILAICKDHLTPGGVAYVSYNIFPGWHVGAMIREMLAFHVPPQAAALDRVREAREFLDFLLEAIPNTEGGFRAVLQEEVDRLRAQSDTYLFHEYLEEVNRPTYFHEFVARAAGRGLQYLAEARVDPMAGVDPGGAGQGRPSWPEDIIEREQYFDLIYCRNFRRTLLCHAAEPVCRPPDAGRIAALYFSALVRPVSAKADCLSTQPEEFYGIDAKLRFRTTEAGVKAALMALYDAWPRAVSLDELAERVQARLGQGTGAAPVAPQEIRRRLARFLLSSFLTNLIDLQTQAPAFILEVRPCPRASSLARYQARQGEARVTNLRHRTAELEPVERVLLPYLDGTCDQVQLREVLEAKLKDGSLKLKAGEGQTDPDLSEAVTAALQELAVKALLVP